MQPDYNPAKSNDLAAAKLWELLRRNPKFIRYAEQLSRLSRKTGRWRNGWYYTKKAILARDFTNSLATFVARWFFRPERWDVGLNFESTVGSESGGHQSGVGGKPFKIDTFQRLIDVEKAGRSYVGPLTVKGGQFSLQTTWPKTPAMFQFLFAWLASEIEFWRVPEISLLQRVVFTPKEIQRMPEEDSTISGLQELFDAYDVLAIPRIPFSKKQKAKTISLYPKIDYSTGLGKAKAIRELIQQYRSEAKTSETSEWRTITHDRYFKMEHLMNAFWPSFGLWEILLFHFFELPVRNESKAITSSLVNRTREEFDGVSPVERVNLKIMGRMLQKLRRLDHWHRSPFSPANYLK